MLVVPKNIYIKIPKNKSIHARITFNEHTNTIHGVMVFKILA